MGDPAVELKKVCQLDAENETFMQVASFDAFTASSFNELLDETWASSPGTYTIKSDQIALYVYWEKNESVANGLGLLLFIIQIMLASCSGICAFLGCIIFSLTSCCVWVGSSPPPPPSTSVMVQLQPQYQQPQYGQPQQPQYGQPQNGQQQNGQPQLQPQTA